MLRVLAEAVHRSAGRPTLTRTSSTGTRDHLSADASARSDMHDRDPLRRPEQAVDSMLLDRLRGVRRRVDLARSGYARLHNGRNHRRTRMPSSGGLKLTTLSSVGPGSTKSMVWN